MTERDDHTDEVRFDPDDDQPNETGADQDAPVDEAQSDLTGDGPPDPRSGRADEPAFRLAQALESLKRARRNADDHTVTSDAPTRMSWSSVTAEDGAERDQTEPHRPEPEERPTEAGPGSSFTFDLGSALARLAGDDPAPLTAGPTPGAPVESSGSPTPNDDVPPAPTPQARAASGPAAPAPEHPAAPSQAAPTPEHPAAPSQAAPTPDVATPPDSAPFPELPVRRGRVDPKPTPPANPSADRTPPAQPSPAGPPPGRSIDPTPVAEAPTQHAHAPGEPARRPTNAANRSVFDDASPAPSLPTDPQRTPSLEPSAPVIPPGAVANLPTLPAVAPAAPSPVAESNAGAPDAPDIHAVRSYQLKAKREQKRGKVFGRTLLALVLLGGAVAAAVTYGRSYLFDTAWDAQLTPAVNAIQDSRGGEFSEAVPLEALPAAEYAPLALELTVGEAWSDRLPEWRALGVAVGDGDNPDIPTAVAAWRPAMFDPVGNRIIQVADGDPAATDAAIRLALEEAYERQHGRTPNDTFGDTDDAGSTIVDGVLGVSPTAQINSNAIDRAQLTTTALDDTTDDDTTDDGSTGDGSTDDGTVAGDVVFGDESQAPLPLQYQFAAVDTFGAPLIAAAAPESAEWSYGDVYPGDVLTATEVTARRAGSPTIPAGAQTTSSPVALGLDNWSLIWANRIPEQTVERLTTLVDADVYQRFDQDGRACFAAAFDTSTETGAADLMGSLARWVANSPDAAAAAALLTAPTRVELSSCDPGAEAGYVVDANAVSGVVERQLARL